jgi:polar amino acid transport system substrate-binding protein
VSGKSAYDLYLSRELKKAQLVPATSQDTAIDLIIEGKVDVLAGVRQHLEAHLAKLPGASIFAERFMAIRQAVGMPKGRNEAMPYLRAFVEDVKGSGFVAKAVERSGIKGVTIVPPAK